MTKTIKRRPPESVAGYEQYRQEVTGQMLDIYTDSYPNFGWEPENTSRTLAGVDKYTVTFRRALGITNRTELTRLQRMFNSYVKEIEIMEKAKTAEAAAAACITGVLGAAFLAGSVFCYVGGLMLLCVVLAIPGFAGLVLPFLLYAALRKRKAAAVQPYIDQKYEDLYAVCERAYSLLPQ